MTSSQPHGLHRRTRTRLGHVVAGALFIALFSLSSPGLAAKEPAKEKVARLSPAPAAKNDARLEQIGAGDMVRVNVFRNPELTTESRVSDGGTIMFPLIGEVSVKGLTPAQVAKRIEQKLSSGKFVVDPEVTVSLAQVNSRQVSVLGNVQKPGRYPLDSTTAKLTDLLALAGGIAPTGDDRVTVMTHRSGKPERFDVDVAEMIATGALEKNIELQPGDTIYVGRAPMIYVYGEVNKAGAYRIEKDMTVMQAIALGGGLSPRASERNIRVHRKNGDGQVHRMEVKLTDPVQVDDVIYVKESFF